VDLVCLSGEHALPNDGAPGAPPVPLPPRFLVCPANTSPHKNHEVLLRGVARWGRRWPLVLTGAGTTLATPTRRWLRPVRWLLERARLVAPHREPGLMRLARHLGFEPGHSLFPLGYLEDPAYYAVLARASALVMPTLAEGGGSFPVEEALLRGIPVVSSDIPVMREQIERRLGGRAIWFDPRDPEALARALADLEAHYEEHLAGARRQVPHLRVRRWGDVARDYWRLFGAADQARGEPESRVAAGAGAR
jgi:glycosyltransferase involved in cell wall biosynthesis